MKDDKDDIDGCVIRDRNKERLIDDCLVDCTCLKNDAIYPDIVVNNVEWSVEWKELGMKLISFPHISQRN